MKYTVGGLYARLCFGTLGLPSKGSDERERSLNFFSSGFSMGL